MKSRSWQGHEKVWVKPPFQIVCNFSSQKSVNWYEIFPEQKELMLIKNIFAGNLSQLQVRSEILTILYLTSIGTELFHSNYDSFNKGMLQIWRLRQRFVRFKHQVLWEPHGEIIHFQVSFRCQVLPSGRRYRKIGLCVPTFQYGLSAKLLRFFYSYIQFSE